MRKIFHFNKKAIILLAFLPIVTLAGCANSAQTSVPAVDKSEESTATETIESAAQGSVDMDESVEMEEDAESKLTDDESEQVESVVVEETVLTEEALYRKYLDILDNIQSEYNNGNGVYSADAEVSVKDARGLVYAELMDFNYDGIEELILAYANGTGINLDNWAATYTVQVWGETQGQVTKLYEDYPFTDYVECFIPYVEDESEIFLVKGYGLHELENNKWTELKLQDGEFVREHELIIDIDGANEDYSEAYGVRALTYDDRSLPLSKLLDILDEKEGTARFQMLDMDEMVDGDALRILNYTIERLMKGPDEPSIEQIRELMVSHYQNLLDPEGDCVSFDFDDYWEGDVIVMTLRYQASDNEIAEYEEETGMMYSAANKYMAQIYVDTSSGEVTDEWDWDSWNYRE